MMYELRRMYLYSLPKLASIGKSHHGWIFDFPNLFRPEVLPQLERCVSSFYSQKPSNTQVAHSIALLHDRGDYSIQNR